MPSLHAFVVATGNSPWYHKAADRKHAFLHCGWHSMCPPVSNCWAVLQIIDFLAGVAKEHGQVTGVANLIGNMCIKPAHLTSDEEAGSNCRLQVASHMLQFVYACPALKLVHQCDCMRWSCSMQLQV